MRPLRPWILALAALAGCSSVSVNTEYDPAAPFATYRTYAWLPAEPGPEQAAPMRNPDVLARVKVAFDREMAAKGLVRTTVDSSPDFLVTVLGWRDTVVDVTQYGYAYSPSYLGPALTASERQGYTEGTLLVDFVDAKTRKLVWRGTATDAITSPESVRASIDEAAKKLLAAYPPRR